MAEEQFSAERVFCMVLLLALLCGVVLGTVLAGVAVYRWSQTPIPVACVECGGNGWISNKCSQCGGAGKVLPGAALTPEE